MTKDIMDCAKMKEFPQYKGICRLSGVCNKHPDHEGRQVTLEGEFDLWGGSTAEGQRKCSSGAIMRKTRTLPHRSPSKTEFPLRNHFLRQATAPLCWAIPSHDP